MELSTFRPTITVTITAEVTTKMVATTTDTVTSEIISKRLGLAVPSMAGCVGLELVTTDSDKTATAVEVKAVADDDERSVVECEGVGLG